MESNRSSLYLFTGVVVLTFLLAIVLTVVYVNNSPGGAAPQTIAEAETPSGEGAAAAEAPEQESEASDAEQAPEASQSANAEGSSSEDSKSSEADSGGEADGSGDPNVTIEDGVQVVKLTGDDQMQYNINEFRVKAGQPIRIEFEHVGNLPKQAMGHNVVVLEPGTNHAQFAQKGQKYAQQDYIPQGEQAQAKIVAHTEMVGSGGTSSVQFTVKDPGKHPYVCTFPAHFATMNGTMIVEE